MQIAPGVTAEDPATFETRLLEHERSLIALLDHPSRIPMYVDSRLERDMRAGACAKEPETVEWLERELGGKEAQVLYDVGACSGSYSLLACRLGAKVVAFEPSAFNWRQLCRNAALNRADITALPIALGPKTELSTLALSSDLAGAAGHALVGSAPIVLGHSVMVFALDDLRALFPDLPAPSILKCDTDGSEAGVLMGARRTLQSVRSVMVEVRTPTRAAIDSLLVRCGFAELSDHRRIAPDTWNLEYRR